MDTRAFDENISTGGIPPEYEGGGPNPPVYEGGGTGAEPYPSAYEAGGTGAEPYPSAYEAGGTGAEPYPPAYEGSGAGAQPYPSAYEGGGTEAYPPVYEAGGTVGAAYPPVNDGSGVTPPEEEGNQACPSAYLDRPAATILMIFKLTDTLVRVGAVAVSFCFAISIVAALNAVARSGISSAAVILEWLKESGVPMESIQEISDIISSGKTFSISGGPIILAFAIFLPFVLINVLETIAAVRLRFGSGGARTIGILHRILLVFGILKIILAVGMVVILAVSSTQLSDREMGSAIMIVAIAAGILFVALNIPGLFYHSYISRAMKEINYELETEERAEIRPTRLGGLCIFYIVLEGIGILGSLVVSIVMWVALSGLSKQIPFIPSVGYNPIYPLMMAVFHMWMVLKYICVMRCYQNLLDAEGEEARQYEGRSRVIPAMLVVLVMMLFILPTILMCVSISDVTRSVSEKAATFIQNAEETIIEVGNNAKTTVAAVSEAASAAESGALPGSLDASTAAQLEQLQQVLEILDVLGTEP